VLAEKGIVMLCERHGIPFDRDGMCMECLFENRTARGCSFDRELLAFVEALRRRQSADRAAWADAVEKLTGRRPSVGEYAALVRERAPSANRIAGP
jgi:hypothetical protein